MYVTYSRDGTAIAFDRFGAGPAVILVSGAFQHRAIDPQTAQLARLLSEQFTVIHYDRRGRGDSRDTLPYAVEREIEDLDALLKEVGGTAFLFGQSSGAALALEAAAGGLHVPKLALYEPPFNTHEAERQVSQAYTAELHALLAEGRRGDAAALAMAAFGAPVEVVAGMRQLPIWAAFESVAPTLAYDNAVMGDGFVPAERLAGVLSPVLVVDGGDSPAFMGKAADAAAAALPEGRRLTLPGQTHRFESEALAPELVEFFGG